MGHLYKYARPQKPHQAVSTRQSPLPNKHFTLPLTLLARAEEATSHNLRIFYIFFYIWRFLFGYLDELSPAVLSYQEFLY